MVFGPKIDLDKRNMTSIKSDHDFMARKHDAIFYFLVLTTFKASWRPDSENKP